MNDNSMSLSITMVNFSWIRSLAALAVIASQAGAWAAPLPPCPAALQSQAHTSLESLNQQQAKEDQELRRQPSSNYATMNGPVIRELEKRQQREALSERLQTSANQQHHCRLQGADFTS
jgi:hypothetical protein